MYTLLDRNLKFTLRDFFIQQLLLNLEQIYLLFVFISFLRQCLSLPIPVSPENHYVEQAGHDLT